MDKHEGQESYSEGVHEPEFSGDSITWTAAEYVAHEKTGAWYLLFLLAAFSVTAFIYFVLDDLLASITVLVVALSLGYMAARKPHSKDYNLSGDGLMIDAREYNLAEFKSFSIVEEGNVDSIWLKPLARFRPYLILYYSPEDEQKIAEALNIFLPYEPRELDSLDRLAKRLRF